MPLRGYLENAAQCLLNPVGEVFFPLFKSFCILYLHKTCDVSYCLIFFSADKARLPLHNDSISFSVHFETLVK